MSANPKERKINLVISIQINGEENEATITADMKTLSDLLHVFDVTENYLVALSQAITRGEYSLLEQTDKVEDTSIRVQPRQNFKSQL